jgi:hypothetical protein
MAELTPPQIATELAPSLRMLRKRAVHSRLLDRYYDGKSPVPTAITTARLTKAYNALVPVSSAPWGALAVDAAQAKLEIGGIQTGDKRVDRILWDGWQANQMDAESLLGFNASLCAGRSFAFLWRGPDDDLPVITMESAEQMIVRYWAGSRRLRRSAVRYWEDEGTGKAFCTLYTPDFVYKLQEVEGRRRTEDHTVDAGGKVWAKREVIGEDWPLENPWGVVTAIEWPVNRRLKPGEFGHARGEFEHVTGLIDRIQLLTFLGLVVAIWMGFPLRGVIGDKILRDDNNKQLPPFDVKPDGIFQLENPEAKLASYEAADRKLLSIYAELDQFASLTRTPRHHLPMEQGMTNLSADAIRASEGNLDAKIPTHKGSLGEGAEETLRVYGLMLDDPIKVPPTAAMQWINHEQRTIAEMGDAAMKLKDILPTTMIAERVLNMSQSDIARLAAEQASNSFGQMLNEALTGGS